MVTAFPLKQGFMNLTSGDYGVQESRLIHCEADGEVTLTFLDGTTANYTMVAGADRALGTSVINITIVSGSFSLA